MMNLEKRLEVPAEVIFGRRIECDQPLGTSATMPINAWHAMLRAMS